MSHLAWLYDDFAKDAAEELTCLLTAIRKWSAVAQDEFGSRVKARERDGAIPDELYDQFGEEAFSLDDTERAMYGTLAVAIASFTEKYVENICRSQRLTFSARPSWGEKRQALETHLGTKVDDLPGFSGNKRARLLGNCFKHSGGNVSEEFAAAFGGSVGMEIEFEKEDWPQMIEDTRTFLVELSKPL